MRRRLTSQKGEGAVSLHLLSVCNRMKSHETGASMTDLIVISKISTCSWTVDFVRFGSKEAQETYLSGTALSDIPEREYEEFPISEPHSKHPEQLLVPAPSLEKAIVRARDALRNPCSYLRSHFTANPATTLCVADEDPGGRRILEE